MAETAAWIDALERARRYAPFLARSLDRLPDLEAVLAQGEGDKALAWAREHGNHEDTGVALRRERLALATSLAIGDLAGAFPLARVLEELTAFADRALDTAIRTAIDERTGEPRVDGFIALALGKQGVRELNYSSDIDPVLLYDPKTLAHRSKDDAGEAAQRYARRIVKLLSENTAEGYVLRVDLRLRPASEISPMAVPLALALEHYQSAALPWERAAFTRARAAAGDIAAGEAFLETIRPFVWRPQIDFGAMEEIRSLTARIRDASDGPLTPGPGFNVKRGRGGIREIEFLVQTHQLIHGGRDPLLRVQGTRAALDALARAGRLEPEHAAILGDNYERLRVIEHRLQMINDRQTHSLPSGEALDDVARLDGRPDGAALINELRGLTDQTAGIFAELIGAPDAPEVSITPEPMLEEEREERLDTLGFDNAEELSARIAAWRDGRYQTLRSQQALAAFDELTPALLEALAGSDDPMRALIRWEALLERAPSAVTLFRLLNAEPGLLDRLMAALTLAPTLSDELARKPELLDILLDPNALELPGSVEEIVALIERTAERDDYEALLDAIRRVTGELRFALGLQLIEGLSDPVDTGAALSRIAEAALSLAVPAAHAEFAERHGRIEGTELLVLGLGRFGGGALTHASDLDVVYLYAGEASGPSDGARSISATNYYNRLAGRVTAALSVPTAQGALYEIDTRLRPQGAQGPLAVSCEAFEKYQREAAWTWEHMALSRARVLVGSGEGRTTLNAIMRKVIQRQRDPEELRKTVGDMRAQMAEHKSPSGPLDVKRLRGGLVDCEFLVHFFQLRGVTKGGAPLARKHPEAYSPDLGTAIPSLIRAGMLPEDFRPDYDLLTRMLTALRLLAPGGVEPPACAADALARACQVEDYDSLLKRFTDARGRVCALWNQTFAADISDA
ncbi:MAG: bifunctional [glutamate--ammonia ligase]-adenylyl-L-tyrosine phosphorylase/[glutamate--ammonia-ligase] adenylyltransferase [Pseudomonadota bacterium]